MALTIHFVATATSESPGIRSYRASGPDNSVPLSESFGINLMETIGPSGDNAGMGKRKPRRQKRKAQYFIN